MRAAISASSSCSSLLSAVDSTGGGLNNQLAQVSFRTVLTEFGMRKAMLKLRGAWYNDFTVALTGSYLPRSTTQQQYIVGPLSMPMPTCMRVQDALPRTVQKDSHGLQPTHPRFAAEECRAE